MLAIPHLVFASLLAQSVPLSPMVILLLCVVAGVGTVLLLPSRREASLRNVGGVILLAVGLVLAALVTRLAAGAEEGGMGPYFWIFAAIAVFGAVRVVTHPKPVYSALYFILTVFASAGLFLLLWAEFMAAALVLIYAGAILVTYVFVIMLAAEATGGPAGRQLAEYDSQSRDPVIAAAVGFTLMGVMLFVIFDKAQAIVPAGQIASQETDIATGDTRFSPGDASGPRVASAEAPLIVTGNTQELGVFLFNHQPINVELAGLILTVSMIGAIVIARRRVVGEAVAGSPLILAPSTPIDDDPHSIPVSGTRNPRAKEYPET